MTDVKIHGINKVTVNSVDEENILDVKVRLMTDDLNEDLVEVLFTPNTIEGVGFKQYAKVWVIQVVHDGKSTVWDSYIDDDAAGAVIPNFSIEYDIGGGNTMLFTFEASKCYVLNRDELLVKIEQKRTPGSIFVVCIGTLVVTYP